MNFKASPDQWADKFREIKAWLSGSGRLIQSDDLEWFLNTVIDCPMTFILPEIEDDCHGCWFEIRFRHAGSYSSTLVPPEGVKVATEHTQAETAGMNMVNLHYSSVGGAKVWRFMNTHSTIPA